MHALQLHAESSYHFIKTPLTCQQANCNIQQILSKYLLIPRRAEGARISSCIFICVTHEHVFPLKRRKTGKIKWAKIRPAQKRALQRFETVIVLCGRTQGK